MSGPDPTPRSRGQLTAEIWIVLALSLGASGVYSFVTIIRKATEPGGLGGQVATLNSSRSPRQVFDFIYTVLDIGFAFAIVALALYLLSLDGGRPVWTRLGLDRARPAFDSLSGLGLTALIGIPGLGLYFTARAFGLSAQVIPAPDVEYWWTIPTLILAAFQNAVVEEVIVIGFVLTRLRQLDWNVWPAIIAAAALRGSYHLYQGVGGGVGNFVMGLVFGYWFHRTGRVMPLVIAHTLLDVFAFVGYLLFADNLGLK